VLSFSIDSPDIPAKYWDEDPAGMVFLHVNFPTYTSYNPLVPVWCITPCGYGYIHRFFDTSPVSPSGRYVGLTRLPYEDRLPRPGDRADVVIVDLHTGSKKVIAQTAGWDTQLGAQVQWGRDDTELYYNDVDVSTWKAYGIKLNPQSGASMALEGSVYMISSDGRHAASPALEKMGMTQAGYGVIIPEQEIQPNQGAPSDDGIFITDTQTGEKELLVSLREIVEKATPSINLDEYAHGDFYGFHVKWNAAGDRLLFVLRWKPHDEGRKKHNAITVAADGSDIHVAMSEDDWGKGGHHPNWCPDGESMMMNLKIDGILRFIKAPYNGRNIEILAPGLLGSGHPTLHPDEVHILTDAYTYESMTLPDGSVPIRWIDTRDSSEEILVRIPALPDCPGPKLELRVDPHPAWDRDYRRIVFNGVENGKRRVYLADLSELF
jgi:hypothetical protein